MIPIRSIAATLAGAVLAACSSGSGSAVNSQPVNDLSPKAKIVVFDVSGMT